MSAALFGWFDWCRYEPRIPVFFGKIERTDDNVAKLHRQGLSVRQISMRTGMSKSSVYERVMKVRPVQKRQKRKPEGYIDEHRAPILGHRKIGTPVREIARMYGIPQGSLRGWLTRNEED